MAQSLDSAQITECLAGFDVDHIIRCLATAVQNKVILTTQRAKPYSASPETLAYCAIFLEPACKEKLLKATPSNDGLGSPLSHCSAFMSRDDSSVGASFSSAPPQDPLNNLALRVSPNQWDIYGFIRDVMVGFRLQPEVSVVTLFYMDRFCTRSGVSVTPDNWQRLLITCMMLASKVWDDESFENIEFAQLCPLYTLEEINRFEMVFLKCIDYDVSCKGSDYAKTYFLLRTLGAKDSPEFGLAPMDPVRASRMAERSLMKQVEWRERFAQAQARVDEQADPTNNPLNWTL